MFAAASETFSRRNINQSIAESLDTYRERDATGARNAASRFAPMSRPRSAARSKAPSRLAPSRRCRRALLDMGAYEVAVSDTIGDRASRPGAAASSTRSPSAVPLDRIALHFHDTRGTALANVLAALELGVTTFDASAGGLGGCPYAPGATGNLATEDLLYMLDGLGIETGVDLDARRSPRRASWRRKIGHPLASRYAAAAKADASQRGSLPSASAFYLVTFMPCNSLRRCALPSRPATPRTRRRPSSSRRDRRARVRVARARWRSR